MPRRGKWINLPDGGGMAHVCYDAPNCKWCNREGNLLCDGPSKRKSGKGTCDNRLCVFHTTRKVIDGKAYDLCPDCRKQGHSVQISLFSAVGPVSSE